MPFRRRFKRRFKRRRLYKRRAIQTRFGLRPSLYRSSITNNMVHSFKSNVNLGSFVWTSNADALAGYQFKLSDLANYAAYIGLYDQYRIKYIVFKMILRATGLSMIEEHNNGDTGMPRMYYVVDRDDSNAPPSVNAIREYSKARMHCFTPDRRLFKLGFKPNTLGIVYQSGIANSYEVLFDKWIDCADSGATPYYGVKVVCPTISSVAMNIVADIECSYYFQCRNPRN